MKKQISMKDISEEAGVSIATVSRIINHNGRYSKETEERVMEIIRKNHYVPNMVAKGLRTQNMKNIGIIVPDITNEFFVKLVHEIGKNLFEKGYGCFLCNTDEHPDVESMHVNMMITQKVCGLIYLSGTDTSETEEARNLPTVYIDRVPKYPRSNCCIVKSDNVDGGYLATKELLDSGCRKILMITSEKPVSAYEERFEGYVRALTRAGLRAGDIRALYLERLHYQDAYEKMNEFLDSGEELPDGIFAASDWLALGCYKAVTEHGFSVPEDVKIVGYDDISITAFNTVPISTVHQQIGLLGKTAVEEILQAAGKRSSSRAETAAIRNIPVYLVPRASTRGRNYTEDGKT